MAPACSRRAVRGALLIESLVAATVFAVGILGTVAYQAAAMREIDAARDRSLAVALTLALVARMRAEGPAGLDARYGAGGEGAAAFARLARALPGGERADNAPSIRVAPGPSAGSRTVTTTVRWQRPDSRGAHRFVASAVIGTN